VVADLSVQDQGLEIVIRDYGLGIGDWGLGIGDDESGE
jgi:anti-sigma regulatory factor (Ser/Thr protein kinase)